MAWLDFKINKQTFRNFAIWFTENSFSIKNPLTIFDQ